MFIFISVYNGKKIRAGVLGGIGFDPFYDYDI
jgi:hypothetical protein